MRIASSCRSSSRAATTASNQAILAPSDDGPCAGSSIERGGDTNGPASVYAITKYVEWLKKYAPPEAAGMTFSESGPVPAQGNIAQQMFWYTAFTADMVKPGLPVVDKDGTAEVAHGADARMAPTGRTA